VERAWPAGVRSAKGAELEAGILRQGLDRPLARAKVVITSSCGCLEMQSCTTRLNALSTNISNLAVSPPSTVRRLNLEEN
jgi:hypothetical protein